MPHHAPGGRCDARSRYDRVRRSPSSAARRRPGPPARSLMPPPAPSMPAESASTQPIEDRRDAELLEDEQREDEQQREREQRRPRRIMRHLDDLVEARIDGRGRGLLVAFLEHEHACAEPPAVLRAIGVVPVRIRARDSRDDGEVVLGRRRAGRPLERRRRATDRAPAAAPRKYSRRSCRGGAGSRRRDVAADRLDQRCTTSQPSPLGYV